MSEYIGEYVVSLTPKAFTDLRFHRHEEIVRCRDCRRYSEHEWIVATDVDDVCHFWHGEPTKVSPDGFCAWGERRGDA